MTPEAAGEAGVTAFENADTEEALAPIEKRRLARAGWTDEQEQAFRAAKLQRAIAMRKAHWQKPHVTFTPDREVDYLAALEVTGNHQAAADMVGVHVRTARKRRQDDETFRANCEIAEERFRHMLVAEAVRRAVDGTDEPVFQGGALVGEKRVYSDRMLEQLLKAKVPEFREKVGIEHSGDVGITTGVLVIPVGTPGATPALRKVMQPQLAASDASDDGGTQ